ncbi:hypothetical protein OSB04_027897, partial [Centaurea solstitialis]
MYYYLSGYKSSCNLVSLSSCLGASLGSCGQDGIANLHKWESVSNYVQKLTNEDGFDILMWWKCNGAKFPILQKIARDVLITKTRSRQKPEIVAALMCTQSWLKKEIRDTKFGESKGFDATIAYDED